MRCSEAMRQLQLYVDRQLTVHQTCTFESHILACAACQKEARLLETMTYALHNLQKVNEPDDLLVHIMERVAVTPQHQNKSLFHLSPFELLAGMLLATLTTLGIALQQPALRAIIPFAHKHDSFTNTFLTMQHMLIALDIGTLTWLLWVGGTLLGVAVTVAFVGNEMRSVWLKALAEHLPVR